MRRLAALAVLAGAVLSLGSPIAAMAAGTRLSDGELAEQRGGLQTPMGLEIGFGVSVRAFVDGQLVLETKLTWTDQGVQTQRVAGASDATALPGGFTVTVPGQTGGATQVLQNLSADRIASVVLNTASNRTIRQDTDITLVVPQLADLQRQVAGDRIAASLQSAVGAALRSRPGP
ncbi:hypothetical protein [Phenylobacterium sp.]|uniref:hypothetical protein n=1 Tax=Phenylobacterium sp. TaxID=1871053 RepID=UPI0035635786